MTLVESLESWKNFYFFIQQTVCKKGTSLWILSKKKLLKYTKRCNNKELRFDIGVLEKKVEIAKLKMSAILVFHTSCFKWLSKNLFSYFTYRNFPIKNKVFLYQKYYVVLENLKTKKKIVASGNFRNYNFKLKQEWQSIIHLYRHKSGGGCLAVLGDKMQKLLKSTAHTRDEILKYHTPYAPHRVCQKYILHTLGDYINFTHTLSWNWIRF